MTKKDGPLLPSVQTCKGSSLSRSTIAGSKVAKFIIRQTLDKANAPNFYPAKFSGYTVSLYLIIIIIAIMHNTYYTVREKYGELFHE